MKVSSAWLLFVVTALYLLVETAFNARLLDVAANPMDSDAVHGIEFWGRIISGVAVSLMVVASLVTQADKGQKVPFIHTFGNSTPWSSGKLFWLISLTFAIAVPAVFFTEKSFVDRQAEAQPAQVLHDASFAVAIAQYVQNGGEVEKIPLSPAVMNSPEGKAFSAMFAQYYVHVISRIANRREVLTDVLAWSEREALPPHVFYGVYSDFAHDMQGRYNQTYRQGVAAYDDALSSMTERADSAYTQMVNQLAEHHWTPDTVPENRRELVREQVQSTFGISLPEDWTASDQDTFRTKIAQKVRERAVRDWAMKSEAMGLEGVGPDLVSFRAFFMSRPIQKQLRATLSDKYGLKLTADIPPNLTQAKFTKQFYEPMMKNRIDSEIALIDTQAADYEAGAGRHCDGVDNYKALMLPGFSLLISLAGIFYHSRKMALYACTGILGKSKNGYMRRLATLALPLILIIIPLTLPPGQIRGSEGYTRLNAVVAQTSPGFGSTILRNVDDWVIRAQPVFYPASHYVHQHIFGGLTFSAGHKAAVCPVRAP